MTALSPSSVPDTHTGVISRRERKVRLRRSRRRKLAGFFAVLLVLTLVGMPLAMMLRGSGLKTAIVRQIAPAYAPLEHPWVTVSRPARDDSSVPCDAFIAVDVQLPNTGHVIDAATVNSG